ncbi:hypothetical protein [Naasia lichenicola]|uniref:Lipoprotein n=1 Tax=Naasia lichenicola TaxID=2565933 RepID=A0A4S4FER5_9MICO|nr:hypothetical protein [Naasia lichenicola]THG28659.1 hypothetical protein E6C64_17865 [Naasia lichenicola]
MGSSSIRFSAIGAVLALGAICLSGCSTGPVAADPDPAATQGTSASAAPSASPSPSAAAQGCPANDAQVPGDAIIGQIGDVDGDGQPDQQFYVEAGGFAYGIHTASGATITLQDDLAGPGSHRGWSVRTGQNQVVTVLDDGRSATLHGFVDCAFTTPIGADGQPYSFSLAGFGDIGTGVACGPADATGFRQIFGIEARVQSDGRYKITSTEVEVSADGSSATNGATTTDPSSYAVDDPRVTTAMTAVCDGVEAVHTSGK